MVTRYAINYTITRTVLLKICWGYGSRNKCPFRNQGNTCVTVCVTVSINYRDAADI